MGVDVLVCNLTRFGDLLQSQQVIDDLRLGGLSSGLICLENFAAATPLLRNITKAWSVPGAKLMAQLDQGWIGACGTLLEYAETVRSEARPAHVLNLTPTLPARILSRLIAGKEGNVLGFGLDKCGFGFNNSVWASFLAVSSRKRASSPFNISNMLRRIALPLSRNLGGSFRLCEPSASAMAWADAFLRQSLSSSGRMPHKFVAFQLGASEERRCWPLDYFRKLGDRLWKEAGVCPVLLGSPAESELAVRYAAGADHPFINAVGRTGLPELAALLRRIGFLVSNDTGTLHLASGMGVPALAFYLATAQPWDTGPLLPGCCCLEPILSCHPCSFGTQCGNDNACRHIIGPEGAGDLVLAWLRTGDWNMGLSTRVLEQARIWVTGDDENGLTGVRRVGIGKSDERDLWHAWMRNFWSHILDRMDMHMGYAPAGAFHLNEKLPSCAVPEKFMSAAVCLDQTADILDSLRDVGKLLSKTPQAGQLFLRNCERMQAMLDGCQPLATLGAFWREFRLNQGDDINRFLPALSILASSFRRYAAAMHAGTDTVV